MFAEFKEFPNVEEKDYDIYSSEEQVQRPGEINQYFMEIIDIVGLIEDGECIKYGITENEYLHPTQETVDKVRKSLENQQTSSILKK